MHGTSSAVRRGIRLGVGIVVLTLLFGGALGRREPEVAMYVRGASEPTVTYHLALAETPSVGRARGRVFVEAVTDLPDSTVVAIAVSSRVRGRYFGAVVEGGRVGVRLGGGCADSNGGRRPGSAFDVTLIVSATYPGFLSGPFHRGPLPPYQPWQVRSVLGDKLERMIGEQVSTAADGHRIVVKGSYRMPATACGFGGRQTYA
jgi:hypothetical protein